jgi:translation initiation factor IF-2-like protein
VRVHELARELGWTPRQLLEELSRRGEFVKSAASTLEAPTVRAIRRDFAAVSDGSDLESTVTPEMYGRSAESHATEESDDSFAAALARAKSRSNPTDAKRKAPQWRSAILQSILDEVIVPRRPEHLDKPYFRWEVKQAEEMNARWAEARLNGLDCDDAEGIEWIRLSDGERPNLATELFQSGVSPKEAQLHLGYGGRVDPRRPTLYERFRDGHMNRSEVIAAVREWRGNSVAG